MADNTKVERIPLSKISVDEKFSDDLYFDDFLVHPKDTAVTDVDLENFQLWRIDSLELRKSGKGVYIDDADLTTSALSDSLSIMEQDIADMYRAQTLHQQICDFVSSSYGIIGKQYRFPLSEPLRTIKQMIDHIRRMGFAILRFHEFQTKGSYIEIHSTNSFILTVALANAAKMPQHHLINLAQSAIFHEIGLTKYVNLISHNKRLSSQEFNLQKAHVLDGLSLLKPYDFPSEVMEGILHHHERLDGSGYPYGIAEGGISDFGRYLGLVCSYVAMTTDQEFRESYMAHNAILALLKGAKVHYDGDLVRLLVQLLSLYPVGSYVSLSNGLVGKVLRNNEKDPRLPIIQLLLGPDNKPIADSRVIQTNEKIRVAQPVPYKQIAPIIANLQKEKSET